MTEAAAYLRQKVFRIPCTVAISIGLRWDFIGASPVDLDLSAVCFTRDGQFLDVVFFNHVFPEGTNEDNLCSDVLVDPRNLPYMFLGGDSRIGGEDENQMPGMALAAKRRKYLFRNHFNNKKHRKGRMLGLAADHIFNRLYEEEEIDQIQKGLDDLTRQLDENGEPLQYRERRELPDEVITFIMHKVPKEADVIFVCATSYTGTDFTLLSNVKCSIYNETTNEKVGTLDLKSTTGDGTANIICMMHRVSYSSELDGGSTLKSASGRVGVGVVQNYDYWDLRELNMRAFGYTFVDVLPAMLSVMGIPQNSRDGALQLVPNYSLGKETSTDFIRRPLSDLRFGIGWDGEYDLDAFAVMFDEHNNYLDHLYSKGGKLCSYAFHMARHSGDAIDGYRTLGDAEYIDLLTYRTPLNVKSIVFGATYMENFLDREQDAGLFSKNKEKPINDVPNFYMRLQNRTTENPYSLEIDRWNVYKDTVEKKQKKKDHENMYKPKFNSTYKGLDGKTHPVRTVILGAIIKRGEAPFSEAYPFGHLDEHNKTVHTPRSGVEDTQTSKTKDEMYGEKESVYGDVPLFEFLPLHMNVPVDPRSGFSAVIPFVQSTVAYLNMEIQSNGLERPSVGGNLVGSGNVLDAKTDKENMGLEIYHSLWEGSSPLSKLYAIKLQFLEVRNLRPTLPNQFKCHVEAWVHGRSEAKVLGTEPTTVFDNYPYSSPILLDRDHLQWDENNPESSAIFLVHRYDRIRILVYEYATIGTADLDLMAIEGLWNEVSQKESDLYHNVADIWIPLAGTNETVGELHLRVSQASLKKAIKARKKEVHIENALRKSHSKWLSNRLDKKNNEHYHMCSLM